MQRHSGQKEDVTVNVVGCLDHCATVVDVKGAADAVAIVMAEKIRTSEPVIADYVRTGKVNVEPAYYDFKTGRVTLLR